MKAIHLKNYKLIKKIGQGGMGVVYLAEDLSLGRMVALKMLAPYLVEDPEIMERFQAEARSQARLIHPNIIMVYSFQETEDQAFLVLEYIEGDTLEHRIKRLKRIPTGESVEIYRKILSAMDYAHSKGVIHRDIKPGNIGFASDDVVKIMDFGIALNTEESGRLTRTGHILGTPQYMAPEQILGQELDLRVDIYALGITLYEMLTGRLPFDSHSDYEVRVAQINRTPPPPTSFGHPDITPPLEEVILKALAKDPGGRFTTAGEFLQALEDAVSREYLITKISNADAERSTRALETPASSGAAKKTPPGARAAVKKTPPDARAAVKKTPPDARVAVKKTPPGAGATVKTPPAGPAVAPPKADTPWSSQAERSWWRGWQPLVLIPLAFLASLVTLMVYRPDFTRWGTQQVAGPATESRTASKPVSPGTAASQAVQPGKRPAAAEVKARPEAGAKPQEAQAVKRDEVKTATVAARPAAPAATTKPAESPEPVRLAASPAMAKPALAPVEKTQATAPPPPAVIPAPVSPSSPAARPAALSQPAKDDGSKGEPQVVASLPPAAKKPAPKPPGPEPEEIQQALKAKLKENGFAGIKVDVDKNGKVHLSGGVKNPDQRNRVLEIVKSAGVATLIDDKRLTVVKRVAERPVEKRIREKPAEIMEQPRKPLPPKLD